MNIVWRRPDGSISITVIKPSALELMEAIRSADPERIESAMRDMRVTTTPEEWAERNGLTPQEHAEKLMIMGREDEVVWIAEGSDPKKRPQWFDWEIVGFGMEVPTDRTFRDALQCNNGRLEHSIEKAKEIQHTRRRVARDAELKPLDLQVNINITNPARLAEIEAQRQVIRDKYAELQTAIDSCRSTDELKAVLP